MDERPLERLSSQHFCHVAVWRDAVREGFLSLPAWSHTGVISRFSNAKQLLPHSSYERRLLWVFSVRAPWEKAIAVWGRGIKLCHLEQRLKKPTEISRKKA